MGLGRAAAGKTLALMERAASNPAAVPRATARPIAGAVQTWSEAGAFWLLLGVLAWAPFPLGSNRPWSWSLLVFLVSGCWLLWTISVWNAPARLRPLRRLIIPLLLSGLALAWAVLQAQSWMPQSWVHPVWELGGELLGETLPGSISIDPWRTLTEAMKLGAYILAAILAFMLSQNAERAHRLLDALLLFGALYAVYALILGLSGLTQENLFYETRPTSRAFAGPFVSPNNFATFMGLSMLCAVARLLDLSARTVIVGRGPRQFAVSGIHFLFGTGAVFAVAFIFTFAMLVATGSRAGFIASLAGLATAILFAGLMAREWAARGWAVLGVCVMIASMAGLFMVTGDNLGARLDALARVGGFDQTRWLLWEASMRMIGDSPWLGLGLGTFEPAYPLYADRVMPFINDKAHNDFLEFAAGLGLPAAAAWWLAMLALLWMCIRGVFVRRRNRHYAQLGIAATVLVGVHSIFDFSLQIPAVALTYAVILGLSVAQSAPTRHAEFE